MVRILPLCSRLVRDFGLFSIVVNYKLRIVLCFTVYLRKIFFLQNRQICLLFTWEMMGKRRGLSQSQRHQI